MDNQEDELQYQGYKNVQEVEKMVTEKMKGLKNKFEEDGGEFIRDDTLVEIYRLACLLNLGAVNKLDDQYRKQRWDADDKKDGKLICELILKERNEIKSLIDERAREIANWVGLDIKEFEKLYQQIKNHVLIQKKLETYDELLKNSIGYFDRKSLQADDISSYISKQIAEYNKVKYESKSPNLPTTDLKTTVVCDRVSRTTDIRVSDIFQNKELLTSESNLYGLVLRYQQIVKQDEDDLKEDE